MRRTLFVTPSLPLVDPSVEPAISTLLAVRSARDSGEAVTVLAAFPPSRSIPFTWARHQFAGQGIVLDCLFQPHGTENVTAYAVHRWLRQRRFDRVVFVDHKALGYFAVTAKWQGLDYLECELCTLAVMPSDLMWEERGQFWSGPEDLQRLFMERRAVELSDVLLSVSPDLVEHYRRTVGSLPPTELITLRASGSSPAHSIATATTRQASSQQTICFAGAADSLNGIELFCSALRIFAARYENSGEVPPSIALVGRPGKIVNHEDGFVYALNTLRNVELSLVITGTESVEEDLAFLQTRDAVLVACSPASARSALVQLAADAGIGCVVPESSRAVLPEATRIRTYARSARALAEAMTRALAYCWSEAVEPIPATSPVHSRARPVNRLGGDAGKLRMPPPAPQRRESAAPSIASPPLVSVCISYFNRPALLKWAIESIRRQTYPRVELIIVDDASPSQESRDYTHSLQEEFTSRNWQLLRNDRELWQAVSRNRAVAAAHGEYVLIMDDDNVAHPNEIEVMLGVAQHTRADVVWCFQNLFEGNEYPDVSEKRARIEFFPVGPFPSIGPVWNTSGDVNALFRKAAFEEMGGYGERVGIGCEDYEIGLKVALGGYRWALVPRALYAYRFSEQQMAKRLWNESLYWSHKRVILPFIERIPADFADIPRLLSEPYYALWQLHGNAWWRQFVGEPDSFRNMSRITQPLHAEFMYQLAGNCLESGAPAAALQVVQPLFNNFPSDERVTRLALKTLAAAGEFEALNRLAEDTGLPDWARKASRSLLDSAQRQPIVPRQRRV